MRNKDKLKEVYKKLSTPEEKLEDLLDLIDPEKIKGEPGKTPTAEELTEIIKPLIPEPVKGDKGDKPTEDELLEMIKPLIPPAIPGKDGNQITPEEVRDKIKELKGKDKLSVLDLKDLEWLKSAEGMQWSSAGFKVYTDSTLTGDGSFANPLSASGVAENYKSKVTTNDTTPSYLNSKISVSGGLTTSITNPGGNEILNIDASGIVPTGFLLLDQTTPQTVINGAPIFSQGAEFGNTGSLGISGSANAYIDSSGNLTASNIYPSLDETYQIGSASYRYTNIYSHNIDTDNIYNSGGFSQFLNYDYSNGWTIGNTYANVNMGVDLHMSGYSIYDGGYPVVTGNGLNISGSQMLTINYSQNVIDTSGNINGSTIYSSSNGFWLGTSATPYMQVITTAGEFNGPGGVNTGGNGVFNGGTGSGTTLDVNGAGTFVGNVNTTYGNFIQNSYTVLDTGSGVTVDQTNPQEILNGALKFSQGWEAGISGTLGPSRLANAYLDGSGNLTLDPVSPAYNNLNVMGGGIHAVTFAVGPDNLNISENTSAQMAIGAGIRIAGGSFDLWIEGIGQILNSRGDYILGASGNSIFSNIRTYGGATIMDGSGVLYLINYSSVVTPVEGMIAYNFTTHATTYYNGTIWV